MDVDPLASATIPPDGLGDLDAQVFRAAARAVADLMADYLEHVEDYPVLPPVTPGELRGLFSPRHTDPNRSARSSPTTARSSNPT